jgi:hypothetical protein
VAGLGEGDRGVQDGVLVELGRAKRWCSGLCQREVARPPHAWERALLGGKKRREEGKDIWCMVVVLTKSPIYKTRIATRFAKLGIFKSKGERWRELVMV